MDCCNYTRPFDAVQLAPVALREEAEGFNIPLTIEAKIKALDLIPYPGMAGTTDIGHISNIHPPKKYEVGKRLAYMALRNDYGFRAIPEDAPRFKEMTIDGNQANLTFYNTSREGSNNSFKKHDGYAPFEIKGFEIAGADRVFHPATTQINGGEISVSSSEVSAPVAVRYAFYNIPDGNVVTVLGQPLLPFRTDNW